jgi:hypothetical protein
MVSLPIKWAKVSWYVLITGLALYGSGVVPAIVPALVPATGKQGNGSLFQLAAGSSPTAGNCATWDASKNLIDSGIATCGGSGTAVNSVFGRTGAVTAQSGDYSYSQISSAPTSSTGAIASRPASSLAGNLYFPTDSYYTVLRDNGSTWDYFLYGQKLTPPVAGNFTFANQLSTTATAQTNGAITLAYPASGTTSGDNLSFYYFAAPGTPYTKTFRFIPAWNTIDASRNERTGVCFEESSTGKVIIFDVGVSTTPFMEVNKYTNFSTFSAVYTQVAASPPNWIRLISLRVSDDGTNLTWQWSSDGQNFLRFDQRARNDFFTTGPDRVGACLQSINNSGAFGTTYMTLVSVE